MKNTLLCTFVGLMLLVPLSVNFADADLKCSSTHVLVERSNGNHVCAFPNTAAALGWTVMDAMKGESMMDENMQGESMMDENMQGESMMDENMIEDDVMIDDQGMMGENMEGAMSKSTQGQNMTKLTGQINIGVLASVTGDLSVAGTEVDAAVKLAVDDFNKHLADSDQEWSIVLDVQDIKTDPDVAVEKIEQFSSNGINIVVGPDTSESLARIKDHVDSNNMLLVSCCSTASSLAIENDTIFRLMPNNMVQGQGLALLVEESGIESYVPVWRDDEWGRDLKDAVASDFASAGKVSDGGLSYDPASPDFATVATELNNFVNAHIDTHGSDKVGVLFVGFSEISDFIKEASKHDTLGTVKWFGADTNTRDEVLTGDASVSEFATKAGFTAMHFAPESNPTQDEINTELTTILGREPTSFAYSAYDAVWLIGLAMQEAGSSDTLAIKGAMPAVLETYSGALGAIELDAAGDLKDGNHGIWAIQNGSWALVGDYNSIDDSVSFN